MIKKKKRKVKFSHLIPISKRKKLLSYKSYTMRNIWNKSQEESTLIIHGDTEEVREVLTIQEDIEETIKDKEEIIKVKEAKEVKEVDTVVEEVEVTIIETQMLMLMVSL